MNRLTEEPQRHPPQLEVLYRMTVLANRAASLEEIYDAALEALQVTLGVERASILTFDQAGVMRFRAWRSLSPAYRDAVDGHSPWSADERNARPILVSSVEDDPELEALRPVFEDEGIGALAFIPLLSRDRLLGKFMLYYRFPHQFEREEIDLAENIADNIAFALQRTATEAALRESEKRLRAVIDTAVDGIIVIDEQGIIESVNPAVTDLFGYESSELIGRNVNILMPEPYHIEHDGYLTNYHKSGVRKIIGIGREAEARRKDGSVFPVDLAVSETQLDDRPLFTGIIRDISDRKRAEAERERLMAALAHEQTRLQELTETLEERVLERTKQVRMLASELSLAEERERRRIAQILHDDIQQALVALQMQLHVHAAPADQATETVFNKAKDYIDEIIEATRNLSGELSAPSLTSEKLSDNMAWIASFLAERYHTHIDLDVDESCVILDQDLRAVVLRVVRELLFNVVKHAGVDRARVSARHQGEQILIRVEDEGVGFDVADVAGHGIGAGFGLFSIRERLELLGCRFEIDSRHGAGTRADIIVHVG